MKKFGDRRDGTLIRDLDSMHFIMPIIYPNRADNEAYISETIDLTAIDEYLERKNAQNPEYKYNLFQIIVCAVLKAVTLRPKMNRFIANSNMYQRNDVSAAFVVKKIFSDNGIECMVSIHMNKFSQESQRGAQVFFDREQEEGEALAQALEQRLFVLDPDYARQPSAGDYYILNACPASALVECGFLSNREEERLLAEESYQQRLAQAIACGVEDYFTNSIERRP